jgi:cytoskeletal protein CcmA (bactofilin family)
MLGKGKKPPSDRIETLIGASASFTGHLQTEGGLRIDGMCEGVIEAKGNVVVGVGGKVLADIKAENVSVSGAVKGNITAAGRLEILSTGRVWGDIAVASFLIDEGGFFRGKSTMTGQTDPLMIHSPGEGGAEPEPTEGEVVEVDGQP